MVQGAHASDVVLPGIPAPREGDWVQTFKGRQFWPMDPRQGDFDIEEIAHALSNLCRFGGHSYGFYSVAQHCVLASHACVTYPLEALMHDAAEAYLVDVPRPIKHQLPAYLKIESRLEAALARQFGLTYPWPDAVRQADEILLATEARDLMAPPPASWGLIQQPLADRISLWSPGKAKLAFLYRFWVLSRQSD